MAANEVLFGIAFGLNEPKLFLKIGQIFRVSNDFCLNCIFMYIIYERCTKRGQKMFAYNLLKMEKNVTKGEKSSPKKIAQN